MLNTTHIVLRLPGFHALLEQRLQGLPEESPLVVCAGEDQRALILSASPAAVLVGARPGLRLGDCPNLWHDEAAHVIQANPGRYAAAERALLASLTQDLPDPRIIRAGVLQAAWSQGRRFLPRALRFARERLRSLGYNGAWGIAPGDAVAEIAAAVAPVGETIIVPDDGVPGFLAPHPLRLLPDVSALQLAALAEIGVIRFGQLHDLPPDVLHALFGPEGPRLREIAIRGTRGGEPQQWRGRKRLGEDTADIIRVRMAVAELVADGVAHVLITLGRVPRALLLSLLYTDGKRAGARITTDLPEHEGRWQRLARDELDRLWTRRVRIAEIRLSITWSAAPSGQLSLFVPARQQFRERRLTYAVGLVRRRWGRDLVRYAVL